MRRSLLRTIYLIQWQHLTLGIDDMVREEKDWKVLYDLRIQQLCLDRAAYLWADEV